MQCFKCLSHIPNLTYAMAGIFSAFPTATSNNNNLCAMKQACPNVLQSIRNSLYPKNILYINDRAQFLSNTINICRNYNN